MIATEHSQSVDEFRLNLDQTIDRLNDTGEPEILTVDGEPRAVVLSVETYDEMTKEMQLCRDVANMQRAMEEFEQGKFKEVGAGFDEIHAHLLAFINSRKQEAAK